MPSLRRWIPLILGSSTLAAAPVASADPPEFEPDDPIYFDASVPPVPAIDCQESKDTGYVKGDPFTITVVTVDGEPVEVETANAFSQMQQAAAKDGVGIKVVSGFRTMAEQEYLYACYVNCNCNNCNLAAKPGYSNHQSGHALDLNTGGAGVLSWLNDHGPSYGFTRTVPSEDWHWEWWGGGPPASGPCGTPGYAAEYVAQSFPPASQPAVEVEVGKCIDAWIDLKNTGDQEWNGDTRLAPTPRDVASPLHDPNTWLSPTRIATPDAAEVAPGEVGHFAFRLCASAIGEVFQTFGLVQEGVTWFADDGGPPDTQLEVRIMGTPPAPPPPPPPPPPSTTGGTSDGDSFGGDSKGFGGGEGGEGTGGSSTGDGPDGPGPASGGSSAGGTVGVFDESGCGCREAPGPGGALALLGLLAWRRRRSVR